MKITMRLLLLGCFFVVAFIPIGEGYEWVVWVLILAMLGIVAVYYWILYGVTDAQAREKIRGNVRFSHFSGRVVGYGSQQELQRGRLLITDSELVFVCKQKEGFEVVWTADTAEVKEYAVGKMLSFRRGVIFTLNDESQCRFVISGISKKEALIKQALGWD